MEGGFSVAQGLVRRTSSVERLGEFTSNTALGEVEIRDAVGDVFDIVDLFLAPEVEFLGVALGVTRDRFKVELEERLDWT